MECSCGMLIKLIHNSLEKKANSALSLQNLTFSQMDALQILNNSPSKQLSLKDLEKRLHVAQSTTVGIVSRLEQKGLVRRFGDGGDKRVKWAALTSRGKRLCAEGRELMELAENELLSELTDIERDILMTLLLRVYNSLN